MDAATIALIIQFALKYGVPAAQALLALFVKKDPTQADWDDIFAKAKAYEAYGINPPSTSVLGAL
jgi:hypothetical protein